jgi:hypothetical protein
MVINLLPLKQKRFARSVYRVHRLIAILIVTNLLLISLLVLLLALRINLRKDIDVNARTLSVLGQKSQVVEFNSLRDEINLLAKYAGLAKTNLAIESLAIDRLAQVMSVRPDGLRLNNLDYRYDKDRFKLLLAGVAPNRQVLLDFSSKLETLPWVEAVDLPVASLVGDSNFNFSLTVTTIKDKK